MAKKGGGRKLGGGLGKGKGGKKGGVIVS